MIAGKRYAVQVRVSDIDQQNEYYNDGFSEVVSFIYGTPCVVPTDLVVSKYATKIAKLRWTPIPNVKQYELAYKLKDASGNTWKTQTSYAYEAYATLENSIELYEFRVRSLCSNARTSEWSETVTLPADKTPTKSETPKARTTTQLNTESPSTTNTTPIDKVLNPFDIPVSSENIKPEDIDDKISKIKDLSLTDNTQRCGYAISRNLDCDLTPLPNADTGIDFTNPKGKYVYINGYEILVTRDAGAGLHTGEGLLYYPYLKTRIPVAWSGASIKKATDGDYGCLQGEATAIGSQNGVVAADYRQQVIDLLTSGPHAFSGKFSEALDSLKMSAIGEEISVNSITKYSSAVIQGIEKWTADIKVIYDTIPEPQKSKIGLILDSLNIQINFLISIKTKPLPIAISSIERQHLVTLNDFIQRKLEELAICTVEKLTRVTFTANDNKFRFDNGQDYINSGLIDNMPDYEKLSIGEGKYYVPWLSIDYEQTISLTSIFSEPLKTMINAGIKVKFKASTNIFMNDLSEIMVDKSNLLNFISTGLKIRSNVKTAPNFNKVHNIVVSRENGNVIGKVNIVTGLSKEISSKVLYADMNGTGFRDTEFSETIIETQLNTTHNVMFVKWKINKNQTEKINFQQEANSIGITTSGYAKDIDKIYEAKKGTGAKLEKLFLVTNIKNVQNNGFARRESRYLAILLGDLPTFTHECGHLLNLPHTFCCTDSPVPDNCSSIVSNRCMDKYATKNYMDYREFSNSPLRTHFDYYQWKTAYQWALKY